MTHKIPYKSIVEGGGWRKHNNETIILLSREDAILEAIKIFIRNKIEWDKLPLWEKIISKNTYGRDPFPPKNI